ncbi:thermostable beta-glucosidase B [Dactylonectria estremocensis]|uniref:beta-glucosidase n=1 Tax=Dactylonectria estremocensis TaxID=1079267 RepID=A0A9P9ETP8_9HYPO|nr:thermostable beta-glucosidase B [Dactylonectria estremocensis]
MAPTDVNAVLSKLSLEEKISLLAGFDFWETVPIADKGVPALKVSDGPNGARGATFSGGITAACFPAASSVASTFDVDIAHRIGVGLGEETLTKGARCLLGPTMCTHRHPLGGRNFESFSEDPFLAGKLASQNVQGIQSTGVSATIKHFAANEQETQRLYVDEIVSERALREIYLKPFEFAVKEANPGAVMTGYNKVNGHHCDEHPFLLQQVLRGEWGWDGLVMSDWGGTNSTAESLNAGLDLEMPGPTRWRKKDQVLDAIKAGKLTEETINERAIRVLKFLERENCFNDPAIPDEKAINKPEHQALIREAGAKGMVLLKNEAGLLPLTKEKARGKKIAVLGLAKESLAHGGGSASVNSHYKITPWQGLTEAFKGDDVELTYAKGAHTFRQMPLISEHVVGVDGKSGFTWRTYDIGSSEPASVTHGHPSSEVSLLNGMDVFNKSSELEGTFTAPESATYYFTLTGLGPSKVTFDGETLYEQKENSSDPMGFLLGGVAAPIVKRGLEAGKQYKILISSAPPAPVDGLDLGILEGKTGVRLDHMSAAEHDKDILTEAVELAKAADYAIVFTGHETFWETEGQDQQSFNLPKDGSQDRLVAGVAAVNPNTIVVNSTGVAVALPWLDDIKALVQAWFPGQEAGNAIADILTGAQTPEGHLTATFPKRLEDCPAYGNFPGEYTGRQLTVKYEEGVFVGYRHFDRLSADKVNFPFGFGLSYTTFEHSKLSVKENAANQWTVSVNVANTGSVKGAIAVQVYVGSTKTSPENPVKVLASFKKVTLEPGSSATVELPVHARDIAFWSEAKQRWVIEGGEYNFSVGKNAAELVATSVVNVAGQTYAP